MSITREDLLELKADLISRLDRMEATQNDLTEYQREANGRLASLSSTVAVHEDRFVSMKDHGGRTLTLITGLIVATFSWILHVWK